MDHEFHSIVEKLAILEGRIAPKDKIIAETTAKQKKPALFNNLKKEEKTDEDFVPMVSGVEFAEEKSQDVLSKVKASLQDYLKSAEENIKQDRDLIKKKKEDLDLKKKELKDLELQQKEAEEKQEVEEAMDQKFVVTLQNVTTKKTSTVLISAQDEDDAKDMVRHRAGIGQAIVNAQPARGNEPTTYVVKGGRLMPTQEVEEAIPVTLEETKLSVGDPIIVTAPNEYEGMTGEVVEFSPSGKFVVVRLYNADEECSMHVSDVEYNQYADDEDADEYGEYEDDLDEDPNQTPASGEAAAGTSNPTYAQGSNNTYAESTTAPVKTMNVEWTSGGGSVLVEIHGDERDGFCIKRAGRELPTRFNSLAEAELALEMYMARRKQQIKDSGDADYIEER